MKNLEILQSAESKIPFELRSHFVHALVGALSNYVKPEDWESAIQSAEHCMLAYQESK